MEIKDKIIEIVCGHNKLLDDEIEFRLNTFLQSIDDSQSVDDILNWFTETKSNIRSKVNTKKCNLADVYSDLMWKLNEETLNIEHMSNGFFKVIGVKTETNIRESKNGWYQPMIDQGTESSVVGLLKKDEKYLIEAKFEPGNYDDVLLSPTLQVTYDNLRAIHGGSIPRFAEYFDENSNQKIIFNHRYPEDGGRFYHKRVMNMLVETRDAIEIPDNFYWATLYQIKQMLKMDNIVNPHLRSIMSYL